MRSVCAYRDAGALAEEVDTDAVAVIAAAVARHHNGLQTTTTRKDTQVKLQHHPQSQNKTAASDQ